MRALVRLLAMVVVVAPIAALAVPAGAGYTVRPGDTLSGIAGELGVSTAELANANAIADPNRIRAGQVIDVPRLDGAGQPVAPEISSYTVRPGDTLSGIAAELGVSPAELARANGIADPNRIRAGQVLEMPGSAASRDISAYHVHSIAARRRAAELRYGHHLHVGIHAVHGRLCSRAQGQRGVQ